MHLGIYQNSKVGDDGQKHNKLKIILRFLNLIYSSFIFVEIF